MAYMRLSTNHRQTINKSTAATEALLTQITRLGEPMLDPGGEIDASEVRLSCYRKGTHTRTRTQSHTHTHTHTTNAHHTHTTHTPQTHTTHTPHTHTHTHTPRTNINAFFTERSHTTKTESPSLHIHFISNAIHHHISLTLCKPT